MKGPILKSPVVKRSVMLAGHKTSISMENEFWSAFRDIAKERGLTVANLISAIDADRRSSNLSSITRVFVLKH